MKKTMLSLILVGFAATVFAVDKAELDNRIRALAAKFEAMQAKPDKAIPAENLQKAQGIVLLDRTKGGFIFAYQGGGGVAMVRDPKTQKWGPAAFLGATEASLGFQIGGEQAFFVILLMNTNSTRLLTEPNFEIGGEARGTAGSDTAGEGAKVTSTELNMLVYDDRKGLYGGAAIKGGAITPDDVANSSYYEKSITMKEILFDKKVKSAGAVAELAAKLAEHSRKK